MNRIILFVMLCCFFSISNSEDLHLVGVGEYKELSSTYYYGALYSDSLQGGVKSFLDSASNKKLVMRVVKDKISPRRFYRLWIQTLAINNTESNLNKYEDDILSFTYMLKGSLKRGDEVTIEVESGNTIASVNGRNIKTFKKSGFIDVVLRGWVGRHPPTSSFKDSLLGLDKSNQQHYLLMYRSLFPEKNRYEEIDKWNEKIIVAKVDKKTGGDAIKKDVQIPVPTSLKKVDTDIVVSKKIIKSTPKPTSVQKDNSVLIASKIQPKTTSKVTKKKSTAEQEIQSKYTIAQLRYLQKANVAYYKNLIKHAGKYTKYPKRALRYKQSGYVKVSVEIDSSGKVLNAFVLDKSKYSLLNSAALKSTLKASPFPRMPKLISENKFEFTVPFNFKAN